jgi:hypothetical protein
MITITHTRAEGTLVHGTCRGDDAGPILRQAGFRLSRNIGGGAWYLPHSRDRQAKRWKIRRAVDALRAGGLAVADPQIDETVTRTFAEVEAERRERAKDRAWRYKEYADNAAARSHAATSRGSEMHDAIPLGQPVMGPRDARYRDRARAALERGHHEQQRAEGWARRAKVADAYQARREDLPTTLRRIRKLQADRRVYERALQGSTTYFRDVAERPEQREELHRRISEIDEQLAYWQDVVTRAQTHAVKVWGQAISPRATSRCTAARGWRLSG